jgi:hypothetical protein
MAYLRGPRTGAPLTTAVREVRLAVRHTNPAELPSQDTLRGSGWHLTQLTGDLADLAAILAEQTGHYAERYELLHDTGGGDPRIRLAGACRELDALRRALEQAQGAARDYCAAIGHLAPAGAGTAGERR